MENQNEFLKQSNWIESEYSERAMKAEKTCLN